MAKAKKALKKNTATKTMSKTSAQRKINAQATGNPLNNNPINNSSVSENERTPTRVIIHGVASAGAGLVLAFLLSGLGATIGSLMDPTGWAQIGWAVFGALIGFPLGVYLMALGLGNVLRFNGSWAYGLAGMLVGCGIFFLALRAQAGNLSLIIGSLALVICTLIGYHAPWRRKK